MIKYHRFLICGIRATPCFLGQKSGGSNTTFTVFKLKNFKISSKFNSSLFLGAFSLVIKFEILGEIFLRGIEVLKL